VKGFRAGFRNRNPLVLLVALALLVPALLGFEYLFTSGAWSAIPLKYVLRSPTDSFIYVSWAVGKNKQHPPTLPSIYLTGGSAAREAITTDGALAKLVHRFGGPRVAVWDLGSNNQNFAETMAVADNVPGRKAWLLIGVNRDRFTFFPSENENEVVGRDFLLKSTSLQRYVADTYGRHKYSFTILPGIFSYLTSYAKKNGKALLEGRPPARTFVQHHYSLKRVLSAAKKRSLVDRWLQRRHPMFKGNLSFNLAMLEQILRRSRERGVRPVLVELPTNSQIIGDRLDAVVAQYRRPVQALATKYGVPYLDFNAQAAIPNGDFYDLSHLVEPGRVIWQRQLARELVKLLGPSGDGQGGQR
jgi:hypothetical protein